MLGKIKLRISFERYVDLKVSNLEIFPHYAKYIE